MGRKKKEIVTGVIKEDEDKPETKKEKPEKKK
jgi:hypothetical protein